MAAQATFSWLPNSETNLAGYKIYYGISSRNYTNVIDIGLPDPTNGRIQATVDNLTAGETYYFAATAYDSNGLESDYSAEINHTIENAVIEPQPSGQADFSWLPNSEPNLTGYKIYYGTASRTYTNILDIGLPDPVDGRIHGTVTALTPGETYYFAATAYDSTGAESDYSDEIVYTVVSSPSAALPVTADSAVSGFEDTPITGVLDVSNPSGLPLQYAVTTNPAHGTLTVEDATGQFTFHPQPDFNGLDSFSFTAANDNGVSNSATVTITVQPVNDPPTAVNTSITTSEDSIINGSLNATDIDGDTLSYALVDLPGNGTVTINTNGTFTYTPSGNTNGTDTFTFKAGDGTTDSNTATVSMTINAVNDVPIADNQSISAVAGSTISGLLTGADPDGDNLTFAMTAAATQGDVTINIDGTFTYTARQDAAGSDSFTFTANDGVSNSTPATVTIAITENTIGFQFELHELQVDSSWQSLSYDSPFTNPVVIARASSFTDSETGVVRVKNITGAGMELRFQEWDSLDDQHPPETITVMVVEAGSFTLDDGTMIEAGCFSASGASGFSAHSFQLSMSTPPVVMTAVDTMNETDAVTTRIRNITTDGFEFMMREQEINAAAHAEETACYLAWEPSTGSLGNMQYEVAVTGDTITDNAYPISYGSRFIELPIILAAMQTTDGGDTAVLRINTGTIEGMNVRVSEEQSRDSETAHTTERGGYIAIANFNPAGDPDGDALVTADEENIYNTHPGVADTDHDGIDDGAEIAYWQDHGNSWDNDIDNDGLINILDPDADNDGMVDGSEIAAGFDPADPASVPTFPIMEGGEVDLDSSWLHVDFSGTFSKPVIIARLAGKNNSEPCVVRIDNVSSTGFDLRLQEYGYLDGIHSIEQVSYLVMEAGHYTMADGTQIEAGTFSTNATSSYDGRVFSRTFSQTPVVITSVSSTNEADTVTARIRKIDGNGFECRLQEQESNTRSHLTESLAYIAWEPSNGSENGLRYEVGRSADTVTHTPTTLNYTTGFSGKPLLYTDMQTTDGGDTSSLRTLSNEAATLQVQVEEEQSRDTEIAHTTEVAGFIAILSQ